MFAERCRKKIRTENDEKLALKTGIATNKYKNDRYKSAAQPGSAVFVYWSTRYVWSEKLIRK